MSVEPHLVHDIDKGLSVAPAEVTNELDFVLAGEYFQNERRDLVFGEVSGD